MHQFKALRDGAFSKSGSSEFKFSAIHWMSPADKASDTASFIAPRHNAAKRPSPRSSSVATTSGGKWHVASHKASVQLVAYPDSRPAANKRFRNDSRSGRKPATLIRRIAC